MEILDSGERQTFFTGANRDLSVGKGNFNLMPPYALLKLAQHYESGCAKYGDRNWEKGIPVSRYLDSATRHLIKHLACQKDEPHLISSCWNLLCAIETLERIRIGKLPKELDDPNPYLSE